MTSLYEIRKEERFAEIAPCFSDYLPNELIYNIVDHEMKEYLIVPEGRNPCSMLFDCLLRDVDTPMEEDFWQTVFVPGVDPEELMDVMYFDDDDEEQALINYSIN